MPEETITETVAYEKRYWYPHMKPNDIAIWERFIEKFPEEYDNCQYDVPVGDDPHFDTEISPETRGDTWKLYQKKIDVVALRGGRVDIIELKPKAGASAVGQVKLYKKLYIRDYSPDEPPRCVIITDAASSDVVAFAKEEGVTVVVV